MKIYKITVKATGQEIFCSSIAALYEVMTPEEAGCNLRTIWNKGTSKKGYSETRRLIIERVELHSKPQANKHVFVK